MRRPVSVAGFMCYAALSATLATRFNFTRIPNTVAHAAFFRGFKTQ